MSEYSRESLAVYKTLIDHLDRREFNYTKKEDSLGIDMIMRGEDLPVEVRFRIIDERKVMRVLSLMPFRVPVEKRMEMASILCRINDRLLNGCFDYDQDEGLVIFRLTQSFLGCLIGEELLEYMIGISVATADEYNDKLFLYINDKMTAEEVCS